MQQTTFAFVFFLFLATPTKLNVPLFFGAGEVLRECGDLEGGRRVGWRGKGGGGGGGGDQWLEANVTRSKLKLLFINSCLQKLQKRGKAYFFLGIHAT